MPSKRQRLRANAERCEVSTEKLTCLQMSLGPPPNFAVLFLDDVEYLIFNTAMYQGNGTVSCMSGPIDLSTVYELDVLEIDGELDALEIDDEWIRRPWLCLKCVVPPPRLVRCFNVVDQKEIPRYEGLTLEEVVPLVSGVAFCKQRLFRLLYDILDPMPPELIAIIIDDLRLDKKMIAQIEEFLEDDPKRWERMNYPDLTQAVMICP